MDATEIIENNENKVDIDKNLEKVGEDNKESDEKYEKPKEEIVSDVKDDVNIQSVDKVSGPKSQDQLNTSTSPTSDVGSKHECIENPEISMVCENTDTTADIPTTDEQNSNEINVDTKPETVDHQIISDNSVPIDETEKCKSLNENLQSNMDCDTEALTVDTVGCNDVTNTSNEQINNTSIQDSIDTSKSIQNETDMEQTTSTFKIIKKPSNPVIPITLNKSLGLSLLASEYASSDESDNESSSDTENDVITDNDVSDYTDSDECDNQSPMLSSSSSSLSSSVHSTNENLEDIAAEIEIVTNPNAYRDQIIEIDSNTSSDNDSDVEFVTQTEPKTINKDDEDDNDDDASDDNDGTKKANCKKKQQPLRVKGELMLDELPPIEDLQINVPETECAELGKIYSIVDQLVLVDSLPGTVALDLDTVLFLDKGQKVLGKIFDVIGQITNPLYCIRFNSNEQIKEKKIEIGDIVYVAPKTEYTQFIILGNLMKIRGSDASWENDVEPPQQYLEYSDDEEEKMARRARKQQHKNNDDNDAQNSDQESITSDSTIASSFVSRKRRNPNYQDRQRQINSRRNNYSNSTNNHNESTAHGGNNYGRGNFNQYPVPMPPQSQGMQPPPNFYPGNVPFPFPFNYNSNFMSWHSNYNQYYQQQQYQAFMNNGNGGQPMPFVPQQFSQPPPPTGTITQYPFPPQSLPSTSSQPPKSPQDTRRSQRF